MRVASPASYDSGARQFDRASVRLLRELSHSHRPGAPRGEVALPAVAKLVPREVAHPDVAANVASGEVAHAAVATKLAPGEGRAATIPRDLHGGAKVLHS